MIITRVNPVSAAKVAGLLYVVIGLIAGALVSLVAMGGAALGAAAGEDGADVRRALRCRRDHPAPDLLRRPRLHRHAHHGLAVQHRRRHGRRRRDRSQMNRGARRRRRPWMSRSSSWRARVRLGAAVRLKADTTLDASGPYLLDRRARSGDGAARRRGAVALVQRRLDRAVGRGGRRRGRDAVVRRSELRQERSRPDARRHQRARRAEDAARQGRRPRRASGRDDRRARPRRRAHRRRRTSPPPATSSAPTSRCRRT